jgi:polysaccharide export outer membrane protein
MKILRGRKIFWTGRPRAVLSAILALAALAMSCGAQEPPAADAEGAPRLASGDLLKISVYNVPDLETKARVAGNGDVYLPLVDYVHVAGLTAEEAQAVIEKRLSDGGFVKDPHVTVFVDQSSAQSASILGEVSRPGVYPIFGEQRLFDLVSAAGGLTEKAGRTVTLTHRSDPSQATTIKLARNLADSHEDNVRIFPGDTVVVRRADIVYVVGDVAKPSGFLMDQGTLTVLQAIALAGGTTHTSKLNSVRIIRKNAGGVTETPVELKKILQAKTADVPLQADDILFVPTSATKIMGRRGVDAALQMATAVGIIAIRP